MAKIICANNKDAKNLNILPIKVTPHCYPLTSSQREIWFDQMLHDNMPLYNIGGYVKILGAIDLQLFEQVVNYLVQKSPPRKCTI